MVNERFMIYVKHFMSTWFFIQHQLHGDDFSLPRLKCHKLKSFTRVT